jgi:predicted HicB family RNase H-like nuclease
MRALRGRNNPMPIRDRLGTHKHPISHLRDTADKAGKTKEGGKMKKTMKKRQTIILRISESLATELTREADELGISRNALIALKLQQSK